jgi:hypothetical protein
MSGIFRGDANLFGWTLAIELFIIRREINEVSPRIAHGRRREQFWIGQRPCARFEQILGILVDGRGAADDEYERSVSVQVTAPTETIPMRIG